MSDPKPIANAIAALINAHLASQSRPIVLPSEKGKLITEILKALPIELLQDIRYNFPKIAGKWEHFAVTGDCWSVRNLSDGRQIGVLKERVLIGPNATPHNYVVRLWNDVELGVSNDIAWSNDFNGARIYADRYLRCNGYVVINSEEQTWE